MRVAVLGGKLQGVEACYLAKKAGWQIALVDKNPDPPAARLCDEFYTFDLMDSVKLEALLKTVQFVVPALEDKPVLDAIEVCVRRVGVRLMYDRQAYELSASKLASDRLFAQMGVPAPRPWPLCQFPVTIKPSGASGSEGVQLISHSRQLEAVRKKLGGFDNWVIQEFLEGPSYSIEVAGCNGRYQAFQITELAMDEVYDCKRVLAPAELPAARETEFAQLAVALARQLNLNGIMDVEVIDHGGTFKVLEIDARLPSQTLTAVYHSSGINVLEKLWAGLEPDLEQGYFIKPRQAVIYEHIRVTPARLEVGGEHIMADVGPLVLMPGFFGAQEALTNYQPGQREWVATLIITGADCQEVWQKRSQIISAIMEQCGIKEYWDGEPPLPLLSCS